MIYTARQLEEMHKANRHVTLPRAARLTPLAIDWIRQKGIDVRYDDSPAAQDGKPNPNPVNTTGKEFIWWCDGPCGPAKAAIAAESRQAAIVPSDIPSDPARLVEVIKKLADDVKNNRAAGGILLVKSGAAAVVYANRCPSLRAILGTCRESVEQGVRPLAANVLVIAYPFVTLQQTRNILAQFARGKRELSEDVKQQLKELGACG